MLAHPASLTLVSLLALAGGAAAQTAVPPPARSRSSAPPPRVSIQSDRELDLPVAAPRYVPTIPVSGQRPGRDLTLRLPPPPPPAPPTSSVPPAMVPPGGSMTPTPREGMDPGDVDQPPPVFYGEEIPSETGTIFYVIDRSGSMSEDNQSFVDADGMRRSGSKMDRAKAEIARSIRGLASNFKFNVVAYDCGTLLWSQGLRPADDAAKGSAVAWVVELNPGGRTGTGPATSLALGERSNTSVVLLTDGAPNCGADGLNGHREMIRRNNTQGATIHVFGISASGPYRSFCQAVAADSGGSYFDVP